MRSRASGLAILLFLVAITLSTLTNLQVLAQGTPLVVYGHVYMPDGSPASGASVTVSCEEDVKSTSTDSGGYYQVTLTVTKSQSIKVVAKKGNLQASKTVNAGPSTGKVQVDLTLREATTPGAEGEEAKKPEFKFLELSASKQTVVIGENLIVYGKVKNEGNAAAHEVWVRVYSDERLIASQELGTIKPGETKSFSIEIEANKLGTGEKDLDVRISCKEGASASQMLVSISVIRPSVSFLNIMIPEEVSLGESFKIRGEVRNKGVVKITDVEITVLLEGNVLKRASLGSLGPGEKKEFTLEVVVPPDISISLGSHDLVLVLTGNPATRIEFRQEIIIRASLRVAVEERLGEAERLLNDAKTLLAKAEGIVSVSEEQSLLNKAESDYDEALTLYREGRYDESGKLIQETIQTLESIIASVKSKLLDEAVSRLNSIKSEITDEDLLALISEIEKMIEEASKEKDTTKAVNMLVRTFDLMNALTKISGAGPSLGYEELVQENEKLKEEVRRANIKIIIGTGGGLVTGLIVGLVAGTQIKKGKALN
ncbi:MAG: hypothetical protein DRN90_03430 [Thermoproteota archaeon]|nr:MAG: hypothetical protein DRN90_03430 [Candidatus Korarchaeota archaeon]